MGRVISEMKDRDFMKKSADQKQRFSIRKLSIGAASVLVGTTLFWTNGGVVHADNTSSQSNADHTEQVQQNNPQSEQPTSAQPSKSADNQGAKSNIKLQTDTQQSQQFTLGKKSTSNNNSLSKANEGNNQVAKLNIKSQTDTQQSQQLNLGKKPTSNNNGLNKANKVASKEATQAATANVADKNLTITRKQESNVSDLRN